MGRWNTKANWLSSNSRQLSSAKNLSFRRDQQLHYSLLPKRTRLVCRTVRSDARKAMGFWNNHPITLPGNSRLTCAKKNLPSKRLFVLYHSIYPERSCLEPWELWPDAWEVMGCRDTQTNWILSDPRQPGSTIYHQPEALSSAWASYCPTGGWVPRWDCFETCAIRRQRSRLELCRPWRNKLLRLQRRCPRRLQGAH